MGHEFDYSRFAVQTGYTCMGQRMPASRIIVSKSSVTSSVMPLL